MMGVFAIAGDELGVSWKFISDTLFIDPEMGRNPLPWNTELGVTFGFP